ncbi:unnamed protein product [Prorocentrum cordatum]|uniref:Uncharacterized protein n=1 Tax=Prorocentrum cordatum TaxID=2364126 RepID=A0ABN9TBB0_9DINO|nr:unnamed protein product [Polarella glacialis]
MISWHKQAGECIKRCHGVRRPARCAKQHDQDIDSLLKPCENKPPKNVKHAATRGEAEETFASASAGINRDLRNSAIDLLVTDTSLFCSKRNPHRKKRLKHPCLNLSYHIRLNIILPSSSCSRQVPTTTIMNFGIATFKHAKTPFLMIISWINTSAKRDTLTGTKTTRKSRMNTENEITSTSPNSFSTKILGISINMSKGHMTSMIVSSTIRPQHLKVNRFDDQHLHHGRHHHEEQEDQDEHHQEHHHERHD